MNIAMMTNTYAPFVGGVPVSVQRLAGGLRDAGHSVTIFAPGKPEQSDRAADIVRCGTGLRAGPFVAPSLFGRRPYHEFRRRHFDKIHVQHPMLMGHVACMLSRLHGGPLGFTCLILS